MAILKDWKILLLLFLACIALYTRGLNWHGVEYRDDEIFYYKSTQEMRASQNYLSPTYFGEDRFQKPILFYWFVLLSYQVLGVSWFAARMVAVVSAALSVCLTWKIAREFFDEKVALLSSVIVMTIPLFFRHAKNVVPDMAMNFFIVLALYAAIRFLRNPEEKIFRHLFFITCALGFMIKGFAALIVPILTVIIAAVSLRKHAALVKANFPVGLLIMAVLILPWFFYMMWFHGETYTQHMLVHETQNRLLAGHAENFFVKMGKEFVRGVGFYGQVILNYFAPWCFFLLGAVPLAVQRIRNDEKREELTWLLVWTATVFFFFAMIYWKMSHYILVLTTPFAILVSYYLLEVLAVPCLSRKFIKGYAVLLLLVGFMALSFLHVFLAGSNLIWLGIYGLVGAAFIFLAITSRRPIMAPLAVGVLIIIALSQAKMMVAAGVTAHSTLQRFARTIHEERDPTAIIGVGSNDLHEKEFQVYFDRKVVKAATDEEPETRQLMTALFQEDKIVYCLFIKKDYERVVQDLKRYKINIVQEDDIFRKRLYLDQDFFLSLLKLDRKKIHKYLKEKVILVKKDQNV